jgi:hypothetical protein
MRISSLLIAAALFATAGCSTLQGLLPGAEASAPVEPIAQAVAIAPGAPGDRPTCVP